MEKSRASKSIKNAQVALIFYFINLALNFVSRKIFIDYLGTEVLGLNTMSQNLLGFLNLAELGIGVAISYTLYKPLANKDTKTINEIVSVQGWMYRNIAYVVIAGACVLMCFFPWIFEKAKLPLWYAYGSFTILLASSLLGYFVNYRQIVLTADQKEYKITLNIQGIKILKIIIQIFAIIYLTNGYVYWLILELLMAIITTVILERILKKEYPWLKANWKSGKSLRSKYPQIITKTKQIFFHKIGAFTFTQTSPIIIYAYASLTLVAVYGNYMLVAAGISMLINAIFNGIGAAIGNLIAEENQDKTMSVFNELFSFRFFIVAVICYAYYLLINPFITLWVGKEYLLDHTALLLIVVILFIDLIRTLVDSFINAHGMFQDIWATITEACINIGCSALFGSIWGLRGILLGVLTSLFFIIFLWKPYFLFKKGLNVSVSCYWKLYSKNLMVMFVTFYICKILLPHITIPCTNYTNFFLYAGSITGLFGGILFVGLYCINPYMRKFIHRLICIYK